MNRFLATAFMLVVCLPASAQDHGGHEGHAMPEGQPGASAAYMRAMEGMDASMRDMQMTGDPAGDYARMMIPHHQSAVEMAKAYLASGDGDPELTQLSQDIVSSQEREIGMLRGWLDRHPGR